MKSFKQYNEEVSANNTTQVPGAGDDSSTVVVRRKYKKRPVTKHYIEVNGRRRKQAK